MKRLVALGITLALAACGTRSSLRLLPADELPADLYASPSPERPSDPRTVLVFFTAGGRLRPVERVTEGSASALEFAIRALLAGPTPDEQQLGIQTAIPDRVELLAARPSRSTAILDVSKEFELGAEQSVLLLRLAQVVYTATGLRSMTRVQFLVDGEPVDVVGEDGAPRTGSVGPSDYASFAPT